MCTAVAKPNPNMAPDLQTVNAECSLHTVTAALLSSADSMQCLSALNPSNIQLQLRDQSSMTSTPQVLLPQDQPHCQHHLHLAKHQEMLYYFSSLSSLKTKHTVKDTCRPHVQWKDNTESGLYPHLPGTKDRVEQGLDITFTGTSS